jgi:hypothetical protein
MSKIWFQDFPTNDTLVKGYIDSDTFLGEATFYQKKCNIELDLNNHLNKNNEQLYSHHAYKFAKEALQRKVNNL